jgi:hypothetical protein
MARRTLRVATALLSTVGLTPLAAQRPASAPTYFATVMTPVGALPPLAMPAQLGASRFGVGLDLVYGYGRLSAEQHLPLHTIGAQVELALLGGMLSVSGNGAYLIPDCGVALHCDAFPMVGAAAALRISRWAVADPSRSGFVTLALHAEGGLGFPKGGRARAAAAGPSVTFVGTHGTSGTLRVIGFVTPQAVWGRLRVSDPAEFDQQFGSPLAPGDTTLEKEGVRFLIGGGLAVVNTRARVGLHFGIQHVVVHGARPRVGVSVSWRAP